ncbi:MAG: type IV pilus twitching motility protein PilT [Myxococcota bacterium]
MSDASTPGLLLGRLAVHYKIISMEQLSQLTSLQARRGGAIKLGELMVERGLITPVKLQQLIQVQKQYLAKQRGAKSVSKVSVDSSASGSASSTCPGPTDSSAPAASATHRSAGSETSATSASPDTSISSRPGARIDTYLRAAVSRGASDIHFHADAPIRVRIDGVLQVFDESVVDGETVQALGREILSDVESKALLEHGQIDFAYAIEGLARFRANAYRQQRGFDLVLRSVAPEPPSLESLGLPRELAKFTNYHQGMVLLTGPSGCGKSSTMAALLNIINEERLDHIITVEDPIEFVHVNKRCVINQRQVGPHTQSFSRALKGALREDPDIIALGELRDLETISLALTAAETGHLVLATLHTGNAIRTVNRLIGVFPPNQQAQIRTMVSESLRAVISQRLVPRSDGAGRAPALEILVNTKAVGNTIRDNKTFQLRSALQTGQSHGMKLLDLSLAELVRDGTVSREEALRHAEDPKKFPA